eukprot:c23945_g1_i1 orf=223-879(+)
MAASSPLLSLSSPSTFAITSTALPSPGHQPARFLRLPSSAPLHLFGCLPSSAGQWHFRPLQTHSLLVQCKVSKGDKAPPFTLKDQDGRSVGLSKFKGKPIVLYFYPADETPGCTKEACAFRDSYEKFKKAGAEVIGISGDSPESHKAFARKYRLPFTLLSDEGNKIRKEWQIPGDFFGSLPGRQTYVIDKNGKIQLVFNNQFQPEKHVDETLKILQTM